jgi:hypothetical protein
MHLQQLAVSQCRAETHGTQAPSPYTAGIKAQEFAAVEPAYSPGNKDLIKRRI